MEAGLIPDGAKLEEHLRFIAFTFAELNPDRDQQERIKERTAALRKFHSGDLDCQLVAEAEVGELPILVSLDSRLIALVSPHKCPTPTTH